jgi:hypothetical protein
MSEESAEFMLAYCGLDCGQCGAYRKERCQGCHSERPMHRGCKVKPCAQEKNYSSCAECGEFENLADCKKLNNFISKIFGFIFRSDRIGELNRIREIGLEKFKEKKQQ